jgi:hypothetical protein
MVIYQRPKIGGDFGLFCDELIHIESECIRVEVPPALASLWLPLALPRF